MIDPIQTASVADASRLSHDNSARGRSTAVRGTSFAGELARFASASTATTASASSPPASTPAASTPAASTPSARTAAGTVKAATRPDNEQTKKVTGHPYSRVENGADKGRYLNQVDGSPREGAVFRLVERDDRSLHVYGTGKDKVIVAVMKKDKDTAPAPSTGGASPAAT